MGERRCGGGQLMVTLLRRVLLVRPIPPTILNVGMPFVTPIPSAQPVHEPSMLPFARSLATRVWG